MCNITGSSFRANTVDDSQWNNGTPQRINSKNATPPPSYHTLTTRWQDNGLILAPTPIQSNQTLVDKFVFAVRNSDGEIAYAVASIVVSTR